MPLSSVQSNMRVASASAAVRLLCAAILAGVALVSAQQSLPNDAAVVEMDMSGDQLFHLWRRPQPPVVRMAPRPGLTFAVHNSDVGYERTISAGLTVQKGASAKVDFRIELKAVSSTTLERDDFAFKRLLTPKEMKRYMKRVRLPHKGFNIPMFRLMGINLNRRVSFRDQWMASRSLTQYSKKAKAVRQVIKSHANTSVVVTGTLMARGTSTMPVSVFAFIKVSRVVLEDGTIVRVVSSAPSDVMAATGCGEMVPTMRQTIEVVEL